LACTMQEMDPVKQAIEWRRRLEERNVQSDKDVAELRREVAYLKSLQHEHALTHQKLDEDAAEALAREDALALRYVSCHNLAKCLE